MVDLDYHEKKTISYCLGNWVQYNSALVNRGDITVWIDQNSISQWICHKTTGKPGASDYYSDTAILAVLTIGAVFRQPLRQTQGLAQSLLKLISPELPVPDYTVLCRRRKRLKVSLSIAAKGEPIHIVLDSTGLKVYGEGEWNVRQHGYSKRRTWRKLHLAVNESTKEVVAAVASGNQTGDSEVVGLLIDQVPGQLSQVSADGAYDTARVYQKIDERGAKSAIPPRKGARLWYHDNKKGERHARDEALRSIRKHGRKKWKEQSNYHRRSIAETTMYRIKGIFGGSLSSRLWESQSKEMFLRCRILNRMTTFGMPASYAKK